MTDKRGRSTNTNDTASVTTVSINSVSATTVIAANTERMFLNIAIADVNEPDVAIFIRLFAASVNNNKLGMPLGKFTLGNNNIYKIEWEMPPDNIYTGEVSAITTLGTTVLNVTEY